MSSIINAIILAPNPPSRMHSKLPKVLHECAGLPMVAHSVRLANAVGAERIVIVVDSSSRGVIESTLRPLFEGWSLVYTENNDNGDTIAMIHQGLEAAEEDFEEVLVLNGDMPLVQMRTLKLVRQNAEGRGMSILKARNSIVESGPIDAVRTSVEDESEEEGYIVWGHVKHVREWLTGTKKMDASVVPHDLPGSEPITTGEDLYRVRSRADLSRICQIARDRLVRRHQDSGVCFKDPQRVHLGTDVVIDQDVTIGLDVTLEGNTIIFGGTIIDGPTLVRDSQIASNVHIHPFCHLESAQVARDANIGPYARLRQWTEIGPRVRVGNFVEIKNSTLAPDAKANHLAYIGDANVGSRTNIGAGTITCNYDGFNKHRTIIGDDAFVGSNSTLVAPITLGDGALVAAGSTVTKNVAKDGLVFGRARQVERDGFAKELRLTLANRH